MQSETPAIEGFYNKYGQAVEHAISANLSRVPAPFESVRNPLGCAFWSTFNKPNIENEALVVQTNLVIENGELPLEWQYIYLFTKRILHENGITEIPLYIPLSADEFSIFSAALVRNQPYIDITELAESWAYQARRDAEQTKDYDTRTKLESLTADIVENWIKTTLETKMNQLLDADINFDLGHISAPLQDTDHITQLDILMDKVDKYYWPRDTRRKVELDPAHSYFFLPVPKYQERTQTVQIVAVLEAIARYVPRNAQEETLIRHLQQYPSAVTSYELSNIDRSRSLYEMGKLFEPINELLSDTGVHFASHEGLGFVISGYEDGISNDQQFLYERWQDILTKLLDQGEIEIIQEDQIKLDETGFARLKINTSHPQYNSNVAYFPKNGKVSLTGIRMQAGSEVKFLFLPSAQFRLFWQIAQNGGEIQMPSDRQAKRQLKEVLDRLNDSLVKWGIGYVEEPFVVLDEPQNRLNFTVKNQSDETE